MLIKPAATIRPSEITPEDVYLNRRQFLYATTATLATAALPQYLHAAEDEAEITFAELANSPLSTRETQTPYEDATTYNNFYEFGTGKSTPARTAKKFKTRPWTVKIDGEVEKPGEIDIEDLLSGFILEERIYRLRCVEGWSMVIPWVGLPLAALLKRFQPTSKAKYVKFYTLADPKQMPGVRRRILDFPYIEGLRMDEAMHPLTILSVGMYGKILPNQNGAPVRLVVPWKYGFKSSKSIVRISLVEQQPQTTWNELLPDEYGFYSNVNPNVSHPRWSQARERRIGGGGWFFFFSPKQDTLMFNGYADQVASLYSGMDLEKYF